MRDVTGLGAWGSTAASLLSSTTTVVGHNAEYLIAMHPVLLIDEVFQVILEHCADWPASDYRFILCQLARSCRAWQDPVTDRLWKRLESAEPLLLLLSLDKAETDVVRLRVLMF